MSKYDVLLLVLVVIFCVSLIGGGVGYSVNGVPSQTPGEDTNILIEGAGFYSATLTFGVDNMPAWINVVFIIVNLLALYLLYNALRGNG